MKITIGADPELFVKQNGVYVSGHGLIPGTKAKPFAVKEGHVQVDGVALEFNSKPATTEKAFVTNISSVLQQLRDMVPDYEVVIDAVAHFDQEYLENQPREARELGCDPDFDAYAEGVNEPPDAALNMRTAAGHIHVGWGKDMDPRDPNHFGTCCNIVKQLDVCLGLNSVLFDPDVERKALYGKAGAFRPKPYGLEYRVLSNKWLSSEYLTGFVFRSAVKGMNNVIEGRNQLLNYVNEVREVINTNNKEGALALLGKCDNVEVVNV